jgi:O-succinylbenzoate synthase
MISLYKFHLPLKDPFVTGKDTYNNRSGILIRYLNNSIDLWAEASPLPGFSEESLNDVSKALSENLTELNSFFTSNFTLEKLKKWLKESPSVPSIQFALSYMGLRILSIREGRKLSSYFPFNLEGSVQVNDILGVNTPDDVARHIQCSRNRGFETFKCKADQDPEKLSDILKTAAKENPAVRFRIDANQSWPAEQLSKYGSYFNGLPIEYVEEPCEYHSDNELSNYLSEINLPVALDESVHSFERLRDLKTLFPALFFVIKPELYGNIFELAETISSLKSKRTHMVFSTLLESKIGREMTLFCAALLGDPGLAHGLNTGHLFRNDLLPDFDIRNGRIETENIFRRQGKPVHYNFLNALNGMHS